MAVVRITTIALKLYLTGGIIMFKYYGITELEKSPFKYALVTEPIDFWGYTLSLKQIQENCNKNYDTRDNISINEAYNFIKKSVTEFEEEPHIIRFTSIPDLEGSSFSLVGLAKIWNNETCFIFSNNKRYLSLIKEGVIC